jgi:5-methyltetrahydrofolate--homocysteine methyltransferase
MAMSALLTTTIGEFKNVIKVINDEGKREQIKIVIGGGPVSMDYMDEVGADGYGKDVFEAIASVNQLLGNKEGYFNVQ